MTARVPASWATSSLSLVFPPLPSSQEPIRLRQEGHRHVAQGALLHRFLGRRNHQHRSQGFRRSRKPPRMRQAYRRRPLRAVNISLTGIASARVLRLQDLSLDLNISAISLECFSHSFLSFLSLFLSFLSSLLLLPLVEEKGGSSLCS